MTVGELREKLKNIPDNTEVLCGREDTNWPDGNAVDAKMEPDGTFVILYSEE